MILLVAVLLGVVTSGSMRLAYRPTPSAMRADEAPAAAASFPPAPSMTIPATATVFRGASGWQMSVSPRWRKFDIPDVDEEAAWATGGGSATFGNNINVVVEKSFVHVTLPAYLKLSVANLREIDATVTASEVYAAADHDYGRVQYTGTFDGTALDAVAYLVEIGDGWVVATFSTPKGALADYAPAVEPFLATLKASEI